MALGAQQSSVLRLVLADGLTLVILGLVVGLALITITTRVIASILYGVTATDSITISAAAGLMVLAALLAIYLPARRASRIDPMRALRLE